MRVNECGSSLGSGLAGKIGLGLEELVSDGLVPRLVVKVTSALEVSIVV